MGSEQADYKSWSNDELISRVTQLEAELKSKNESIPTTPTKKTWKKPRTERVFNPGKYSTRLVAFKLAYLGKQYNGFEYTNSITPLPTIEEELWKALNRTRLIFPAGMVNPVDPGEVNWDGLEYSKCGRTDKGVSAFGQVISIRVRSNRPLAKERDPVVDANPEAELGTRAETSGLSEELKPGKKDEDYWNLFPDTEKPTEFNTLPRKNSIEMMSPALGAIEEGLDEITPGDDYLDHEVSDYEEALNFDPIKDEIQYCALLNRQLPPDIRILAWCPAPPQGFSARFSCKERQYKYFFTQPAFSPTPHHLELKSENPEQIKDGWLDIDAMREAARLYEGLHDFRNFCKIDASKQITNFERRIFYANIEEVDDESHALAYINSPEFLPSPPPKTKTPKVYTFTLHGSAFLWHQVRHMVAVLFLVGQGLEKPSIVSELLDTKKNPRRPVYEMATDTPLVLWDCIFPHIDDADRKDAVQWLYVGDGRGNGEAKYGTPGLMDNLWETWRERKIDEILAGSLINLVSKQGAKVAELEKGDAKVNRSQKVFDGNDVPRFQGKYIPVMKKQLMDSAEVINEKYALRKGFQSSEDMKSKGFRAMKKLGKPVNIEV